MKSLLALSLLSSSLLIGSNSVKADENYVFTYNDTTGLNELYKVTTNGASQSFSLITTKNADVVDMRDGWFDASQNKFYFQEYSSSGPTTNFQVYDLINSSWSTQAITNTNDPSPHHNQIATTNRATITTNATNISSNDTDIATNASNISSNDNDISGLQSLISTKSGSTTTARIGDSTKNILEIGPTTNPTTINQSGISVSGGNLIKKDSDGNIHIGKNSFVIGNEVLNGAHPIWAEDENGSKIPLNIYGSDLQINGVSVQGQIDTNKTNIKNLGSGIAGSTALTAALTALPQTSEESKHSCGIGSGAYSSRYAVGFGCASKVNERVDINAGGSYVFGGAKSYGEGTLDNGVIKAGFVFKLGQLKEPIKLSSKGKKNLETKIETLTTKNETLQNTVSTLMARLERLEKVALGDLKSKDLAVYKLQ